jgi:uncharacterized protein
MTPARKADRALLLTPGASATRDHSALVAIDEALAPVPVDRIDLPNRKPPALVELVGEAAARLATRTGLPAERIAVGGRSMGGRMCSMAVAEGLPALALVLVSYPLHPPGKRDQLRVEHFPRIAIPCLFVSGTRDAFATRDELEGATKAIKGPVTHVWVDGGDHGLRRRDAEVAEAVKDWFVGL